MHVTDWITAVSATATAVFTGTLWSVSRRQAKTLEAQSQILSASMQVTQEIAAGATGSTHRMERAYVFLDSPDILAPPQGIRNSSNTVRPEVIVTFTNYGRTPAIPEEMAVVCAYYSPQQVPNKGDRFPTVMNAGTVIGSGENSYLFKVDWRATPEEEILAHDGVGEIALSGALTYRDVFDAIHVTSFIYVYDFKLRSFRTVPNQHLNYFT